MAGSDLMNQLRTRAQAAIANNAVALLADRIAAPSSPPEKQPWNLWAKYRVSNEIADRLKAEHPGRNNHDDALRHAEWSQQMADKVGPVWSAAAGMAHEAAGLAGLHPLSESVMDMHNNAEGIQAATENRPIDPSNLQDRPMAASAAYARANQSYDDTTPDHAFHASRLTGQGTAEHAYKDSPRYDPEARYPPYR